MQSQLDKQIGEIEALNQALRSTEAQNRLLTDERADILRGVASLQHDLNKVRQDAISLGLDLANVRRERDAMGSHGGSVDVKEMEALRKQLARSEQKFKDTKLKAEG